MSDSLSIGELLPHAGPMLLLDRLLEHGEEYLVSEVVVRSDGLFDSGGHVPASLGIEYMAQTVAAYSGLRARSRGELPKVGFLLGTRKFESSIENFSCGDILRVTVKQLIYGSSGLGSFECNLEGQNARQTATLSVYEPPGDKNPMETNS